MLKHFLVIAVLVTFAACSSEDGPVQNLVDLQKRVDKVNKLNNEVEGKRTELFGLIREFNSTRPESEQFDISQMDTMLGAPERELLKAMFKEEKDISFNGLLTTIIEKNKDIANLNEQITNLMAQLPKPYDVKKGDTHFAIVLDYLTKGQKIDREVAREIAWKTALIDDILPGNQIWLTYSDGIVGSYVTQGTAKIAPMKVQILAKKRLIEQAKSAATPEPASPAAASPVAAAQ